MDFEVTCEYCGNKFDNYHLTRFIKDKAACSDCFQNALSKENYYYFKHVPNMCDGVRVDLHTFDSKENLLKFLKEIPRENENLAVDDNNKIMTVTKDGTNWWVHGFVKSTLDLGLPFWKDLTTVNI